MKIAVGSKNPVKIAAVENVVRKIWPEAEIVGMDLSSSTKTQPGTQKEAIDGALKRAELALKETNADFGFGLEGNTFDSEHGMFLDGWAAIVDKHGKKGIASCGALMLPEKLAEEVRQGKELGPATDRIFGHDNIKQKEGTVGMLTSNMIKRTEAFERGVTYALARFLNPKYYN
jgi:inosine/xanthosine triphosphatase